MIFIAIAAGIFTLDFVIKHQVDKKRKLMEESKVCGDKIIIRKYYNDGAALNLLAKRPRIMFAVNAFLMGAVSGLFAYFLTLKDKNGIKLALSFLVGGGMSNLWDRISKHHVVDYFSFNVKNKKLRGIIFNISDFFIFIGAALTLIFGKK